MNRMFLSALARLSRAGRACQSASAFSSSAVASSDVVPSTALCCLKDSRAVLKIKGQDTSTFLQGLLSNDVKAMSNDGAQGIMYSLMLNSQGRFAYDVFLHRQQGEAPDSLMLDVDQEHMGKLIKLLQMYKLRSKVDILNVSDNHEVWVAPGSRGLSSDDPAAAAAAETEGLQWTRDPRLPDLGARTILPAGYIPLGKVVTPQAFKDLRFRLGVPEGCSEIPSGEALPLEYNLDALNGVSYTKGCYVGQELTARTHFRGVIRKRLMPVSFLRLRASPSSRSSSSGESLIGAQVTAEGVKRPIGKVTAVSEQGDTGLAVLRLDSAAAAIEGNMELLVGGGLRVVPRVPAWWPSEWMMAVAADADGAPEAE